MRATAIIIWIVSALVLGCSEDSFVDVIDEDPLGPGPLNHAPIIAPQPDTSAIVGDTLMLQISATDPDGDALYYEVDVSCTWLETSNNNCHSPIARIDYQTGRFWFNPRSYDIPVRHVIVTVSDPHGSSASMEFDVMVSAAEQRM